MEEPQPGSSDPEPEPAPIARPEPEPGLGASRKRQVWRIAISGIAAVVIIVAGGTFVVYRHLNGNLRSAPLYAGLSAPSAAQPPYVDPSGRHPLNILVIGSDSRASKENCEIGHACTGLIHADVELVVHVSADRSNATALSIPRDTMTNLPGCRDRSAKKAIGERRGQINSSLQYGPGCTVAAVEKLTGLTIDHFVMADFVGVIDMSDAVGGASVCVSGNIYDPLSHLKLSKGRHIVKGAAALQFVRTRHAFGDGSDLGRTQSQHLFLSAVIRKLKSSGTLANPVKVYSVAQAATKALTVDTELASVGRLIGLANTLQNVPADRITFVTMPNAPDPHDSNRVVVIPQAKRLFSAMAHDKPLTADNAEPSAQPSAQPAPSATPARVPSNRTQGALKAGHAQTASDTTCAQVSSQPSIYFDGRWMTPSRAFELSKAVPVSAK